MTTSAATRLKEHLKSLKITGLVIVFICFGGVGTWASLAPLSSAAIATGVVSPDSSRKTIQHLEGGIISEILVKEGDIVRKGQPLMKLEEKQAKANFSARWEQWMRLRITRARLEAQVRGSDEFLPSEEFDVNDNNDLELFMKTQSATFRIKNDMKLNQKDILLQQVSQVSSEIMSVNAESEGLRQQIEILEKELGAKNVLLKKDLLRLPDIYALQRRRSELKADIESNNAIVSRASQKGKELELSIQAIDGEFLNEATTELVEINAELAQIEEALLATQDVLSRTVIPSPVDGTVLNVRYKTVGGVVTPGEAIMDIVPSQDDLIIDARLAPNDIDNIYVGMEAKVRISAFLARHMPMLGGEVFHIAPDATTDPNTNESYYAMKIKVNGKEIEQLADNLVLTPGMPTEVFVVTGLHTPIEYLIDPVQRSFQRAFREETLSSQ